MLTHIKYLNERGKVLIEATTSFPAFSWSNEGLPQYILLLGRELKQRTPDTSQECQRQRSVIYKKRILRYGEACFNIWLSN
jgi:hypothetical protein